MDKQQKDLFGFVTQAYEIAGDEGVDNDTLYKQVAARARLPIDQRDSRSPVGADGKERNLFHRAVRWHQQTLKHMGVLERSARGVWKLTKQAADKLTPAPTKIAMLGFSTDLGVAIWGAAEDALGRLDAPVTLALMSPPYPLARARAYGNPSQSEYTDFICRILEPIIKKLRQGGNLCLNIGNDIFEPGSPARSLYKERLVIALCDRFGLKLMDTLVWENPSRPPGPVQWASLKRVQLNATYEPVYWFSNDPHQVIADNRRVLQEHTETHLRLIRQGGEARSTKYGDGAYRLREGSFGNQTEGAIPRNVIKHTHKCASQSDLKKQVERAGLPPHGAVMPLRLAEMLVRFLSDRDDLVVDPFGGSCTTALAAERNGRRWITTDVMAEYVLGSALRFERCHGFARGALFDAFAHENTAT